MDEKPWWHPSEHDHDWDEPLPEVIELSPEYCADLPLWGECGALSWQRTKFSPGLLDRLAAWSARLLLWPLSLLRVMAFTSVTSATVGSVG